MKRRRIILMLLACGLVAVVGAWSFYRPSEPTYQGRKLSKWLHEALPGDANLYCGQAAVNVVCNTGTNALPWLVASINFDRSRLLDLIDTITRRIAVNNLNDIRENRAELALWGFFWLGTNAAPAIPALVVMASKTDAEHQNSANLAIRALVMIGRPAAQSLVAIMKNTASPHRLRVIIDMAHMTDSADILTPPLVECLTAEDGDVRTVARRTLEEIAPNLLTNTPAI